MSKYLIYKGERYVRCDAGHIRFPEGMTLKEAFKIFKQNAEKFLKQRGINGYRIISNSGLPTSNSNEIYGITGASVKVELPKNYVYVRTGALKNNYVYSNEFKKIVELKSTLNYSDFIFYGNILKINGDTAIDTRNGQKYSIIT